MRKNSLLVFVFLAFAAGSVFAQNEKDYVEYNMIQGTLEESDSYKKEFGRYDGFEVYLNSGEYVYFSVFSEEFNPSIVLVDPDGKTHDENQAKGTGFASLKAKVPVTGEWFVYVVGTANSRGNYFYQYAFADSVALSEPQKEFCKETEFLVKHSKAYFLFLQDEEKGLFKMADAEDSFIDGNDGSYNAILFTTDKKDDAEKKFIEFSLKIKSCLGDSWKEYKDGWQTIEDFRQKKVEFSKKTDSNRFAVILKLNDFTSVDTGDFSLEMIFINTK